MPVQPKYDGRRPRWFDFDYYGARHREQWENSLTREEIKEIIQLREAWWSKG